MMTNKGLAKQKLRQQVILWVLHKAILLELLLITHFICLYSLHEGYLCLLVFYRTTTYNNSFSAPMDIFQSLPSLDNIITVFPLQKDVVNKWLIIIQSNFGKVIFLHSCIIHYMCAQFFAISSTKKVIGQHLPSNKKIHCMAVHALTD